MLGRGNPRNLDRVGIASDDGSLKRQIGNFSRLELNESRSKVISPTTKGPFRVILVSRPFHDCPNVSRARVEPERLRPPCGPVNIRTFSSKCDLAAIAAGLTQPPRCDRSKLALSRPSAARDMLRSIVLAPGVS